MACCGKSCGLTAAVVLLIVAIVLGVFWEDEARLRATKLSAFMPEKYHGAGMTHDFFEGWYHKLVTENGDTVAVICGLYLGNTTTGSSTSHSFVMVLEDSKKRVYYYRYPTSALVDVGQASSLDIRVGPNRFTTTGIELNLDASIVDERLSTPGNAPIPSITGAITYSNIRTWPVTIGRPGVMGWLGYVPWMECFHGLLSMHHDTAGSLTLGTPGQEAGRLNFDGGVGYVEKDWGHRFPKAWIWLQTNSFTATADAESTPLPGASLFFALALTPVPYSEVWLPGVISGLLVPNAPPDDVAAGVDQSHVSRARPQGAGEGSESEAALHMFTTWLAVEVKQVDISDAQIVIVLQQGAEELQLTIDRGVATPVLLPAPRHGDMHMLCPEALDAIVHVKLLRHASSGSGETTVMFQGSGRHGGLEVAGDTAALARQALAQGAGINPLDVASMLWGAAMRKDAEYSTAFEEQKDDDVAELSAPQE